MTLHTTYQSPYELDSRGKNKHKKQCSSVLHIELPTHHHAVTTTAIGVNDLAWTASHPLAVGRSNIGMP